MFNLILCLTLLAIVLINVLIGMGRGVQRSRVRAIIVLGCALGAVLLTSLARSFILTDAVMEKNIIPFLEGLQKVDMSMVVEMLNMSTTLRDLVTNTTYSLVTPLLCLAVFFLLCFFSWIIYLAVGVKKKRSPFSGLRGSAWGLLQGLACAIVLLIPFATYLEYAPTVAECVLEADILSPEQEEYVEIGLAEVEPANKGILAVYRTLGGKQISNALSNFKVNKDQSVVMADEIDSVAEFAINIYRISKSPVESYGDTEVLALNAIADSFEDSVLLPTIAGEVIYDATQKWINNEAFFGVAKPQFGEMNELFDPLLTRLLTVLNTDARNTAALQADFRTVADMIAALAKNGVFSNLSNTDELLDVLAKNGVITQLVTSLGKNQSMKILIPEINKLGMRVIATTLGVPENADEIYNSFIDDVVVALNDVRGMENETQQIETLSTHLSAAFDEAGIIIDPVLIDCYSASMITDLVKGSDTTTTEDVQDFFTVLNLSMVEDQNTGSDDSTTEEIAYRQTDALTDTDASKPTLSGSAYADMDEDQIKKTGAATLASAIKKLQSTQTTGDETGEVLITVYADLLVEAPETLEKLGELRLTVAVTEETVEVSAALSSAESVKTVTKKITLDDLLIDSEAAAESITEETVQKEAEAIAAIFEAANELKSQLDQDSEMKLEEVAGAVGNILDSLGQTETFGSDKTANLFTAVLQSETVRETAGLDMKTATEMANSATDSSKGEVSYKQTLTVVTGSISVVTKLGQNGETVTEEELVELIRNLNPQTSGMIEIYVTPQRMESYGIPVEYTGTTADLISSIFHYMANESLTDYDAEAKALNQILTVALSAKDHASADELYTKDGVEGILPGNAYDTVATVLASDAVSYALRSTMLDENGAVIEEKRDPFGWGESMDTESEVYLETVEAIKTYYADHKDDQTKATLIAFAALLGVDAENSGAFN